MRSSVEHARHWHLNSTHEVHYQQQSRFPLAFFTVAAAVLWVMLIHTFLLNDNNVDGFGVSIKYPRHLALFMRKMYEDFVFIQFGVGARMWVCVCLAQSHWGKRVCVCVYKVIARR